MLLLQSSQLIWNEGFGCLRLFEDALAYSPACQFFSRDGNGICVGTALKKVQYVCTQRIVMLQTLLCPTENMQTWRTEAADPEYPGQKIKLLHAQWFFATFLTAPRNVLATHLSSWDGDDEVYAQQVVCATTVFVEKWYPAASPGVPEVATCVQINDSLPYTHNVTASEERTGFGLSSPCWSGDSYKIFAEKVPTVSSGSSPLFTFPLPCVNSTGTEAWTKTPVFHPNHKDDADETSGTVCKTEFLSVEDTWNIGRFQGSMKPLKSTSETRVFRDGGRWAGKIRSPKEVNKEKSLHGMKAGGKKTKPVLVPVKREEWPIKLNTGRKYQRACLVTRANLQAYLEEIRLDPLEGPSEWEEDKDFRRTHKNIPNEEVQRERSRIYGAFPDPGRGSQRSRSASAAGPAAARPIPEAKPTKDPHTGALCYKMSDTSSKSSASSEKWGDLTSSVGDFASAGSSLLRPLPAPTPAPAPPSRGPAASAESGWEVVQEGKDKKRKGPASSVLSSSKSSRMSDAL